MDYLNQNSIDDRVFYKQNLGKKYYKKQEKDLQPEFYQEIDGTRYVKLDDGSYGIEKQITEIAPFPDAVLLSKNVMPSYLRGFWFVGTGPIYGRDDDPDLEEVLYHERAHKILAQNGNPFHLEREVRDITALRYGHH